MYASVWFIVWTNPQQVHGHLVQGSSHSRMVTGYHAVALQCVKRGAVGGSNIWLVSYVMLPSAHQKFVCDVACLMIPRLDCIGTTTTALQDDDVVFPFQNECYIFGTSLHETKRNETNDTTETCLSLTGSSPVLFIELFTPLYSRPKVYSSEEAYPRERIACGVIDKMC